MDRHAKKAIAKNRVKLLGLDYFDLTGPLLAAELLPTKKHKDIKVEASNKGRIDLLLEWIDESAPVDAFPAFLQGIRNCQENILAKKIKKEAAAEGGVDLTKKPAIKLAKPFPSPAVGAGGLSIPGVNSAFGKPKTKSPKPKPIKPKTGVEIKPSLSGLGTLTLPFNGLDALLPLPPIIPTPPSRKRKSGDKPKTPGNLNGTPKTGDGTKVVSKGVTKAEPTPKKPKTDAKIKLPKILDVKIARLTRKSSTSDKGDDDKKPGAKGGKKSSDAASKSPKASGKASKVMTFKAVETKQQDSRQKFRFKNSDAVVKFCHFKDKTDISYLGCPFEENNKVCEKKVELKSKEFVCESRHKNPICKQIPRLTITCNDGSADLQLILLKSNVEIFCGKTSTEIGSLSVNEIKETLDKTVGKKYTMEVHCEKAKKASKKSGVPNWNNLATIWGADGGSPAKKKRKN